MKKVVMALTMIFLSKTLLAGFYEEDGLRGFYFFEDPQEREKAQRENPETPEEAADLMAEQREELYKLRCLAILSPTKDNLIRYIEKQNKILTLSDNFAKQWQYILLDMPELGDMISNPVAASGIEVRKRVEEVSRKGVLDALSEEFFLMLFVNGGDPYSEQAGRIVKQFSSVTNWEVRVISMNGFPSESFLTCEKDKGISQKYGIKQAPAFLIVNPETKEAFSVGVGALSVVELIDNIYLQATRHLLKEAK